MTLPNNKVKLALTEVDYKPFISLFNVTNATVTNPGISGIGENDSRFFRLLLIQSYTADYASAVALELSQSAAGDYEVALKFKNGTNDDGFQSLKMFGQDSLTLPQLIAALDVSSHSLYLTVFHNVSPFLSGPPSTPPSTGASLATRLSSVDALFSTTATIHSLTLRVPPMHKYLIDNAPPGLLTVIFHVLI